MFIYFARISTLRRPTMKTAQTLHHIAQGNKMWASHEKAYRDRGVDASVVTPEYGKNYSGTRRGGRHQNTGNREGQHRQTRETVPCDSFRITRRDPPREQYGNGHSRLGGTRALTTVASKM